MRTHDVVTIGAGSGNMVVDDRIADTVATADEFDIDAEFRRMLFPSQYRLAVAERLPDEYRIIGSGRSSPDSIDEFGDSVREGLTESIDDLDDNTVDLLLSHRDARAGRAR